MTAENVSQVYAREVDRNVARQRYAEQLKERFVVLDELAKPLPKEH